MGSSAKISHLLNAPFSLNLGCPTWLKQSVTFQSFQEFVKKFSRKLDEIGVGTETQLCQCLNSFFVFFIRFFLTIVFLSNVYV